MSAITACRTAALGGHVERATIAAPPRVAYNSCRNRHCRKCQGAAREHWLADRRAELLPVPCFHSTSRFPRDWPPSLSRTRPSSMRSCSRRRRGHDHASRESAQARSEDRRPRDPAPWGQALTTIPTSIASRPAAGCRLTVLDGSRGARTSSRRQAAFRLFRRLFLERLQAALRQRISTSSAISPIWPIPPRCRISGRRAPPRLSSTQEAVRGPAQVSPISAATPIASPSPTAASKPATTNMSGSPGRTIATAAP